MKLAIIVTAGIEVPLDAMLSPPLIPTGLTNQSDIAVEMRTITTITPRNY